MKELFKELDDLGADTNSALIRFMNDEEMYIMYLFRFSEEKYFDKLDDYLNINDYENSIIEIHTFKGIVDNLGLSILCSLSLDMLYSLRNNEIEIALKEYKLIKEEYNKTCIVLNKYKKEYRNQ